MSNKKVERSSRMRLVPVVIVRVLVDNEGL